MRKQINAVLLDESGATAIEYCLIAGSIALVIIGALTLAGGTVAAHYQALADSL